NEYHKSPYSILYGLVQVSWYIWFFCDLLTIQASLFYNIKFRIRNFFNFFFILILKKFLIFIYISLMINFIDIFMIKKVCLLIRLTTWINTCGIIKITNYAIFIM